MATTYKEIPGLIEDRVAFIGNSVTGERDGDDYVVYSYDTPIAIFTDDELTFFDESFYSKTTSKLQNLIRTLSKR